MHIPLTGGSWLTYKIRDLDVNNVGTGREVLLVKQRHPRYVQVGRHTTLDHIYEVSDENLNSYFKFCISRHPYTRFQSAWNYFTNVMEVAKRAKLKNQYDMMSWIEDGALKQHILPQVNWYDKLYDKIFKFEIIEQVDFSEFSLWTSYDKNSNSIERTEYQELEDGLKERIYKHYIKDFQTFDYQP